MSQYLIMPINKAIITASYKSAAYKNKFGVQHYGVDMYSNQNRIVYACGVGKVVCAGYDNVVGNTVAVIYDDVLTANGTKTVAVRCFHLNDVQVKAGQKVNKDTILGHWGATGRYVSGAHLHIEVDADYEHWQGIPGMTPAKSTFYYRGGDTMLNPADVLHPYTKDGQSITWSAARYGGKPYAEQHGFSKTSVLSAEDWEKKYKDEAKAHSKTKAELAAAKKNLAEAEKRIENAAHALGY